MRWAVATLCVLAVMSACGDGSDDDVVTPAQEPPDSEPSIVGVVTDVLGTVLGRGGPGLSVG